MAILILDDHAPETPWAERVRGLLARLQLADTPVWTAADEAAARERPFDPESDVRLILLDPRPDPALATARRLQRDLGPLRPGVVLFTGAPEGPDAEQAAAL